MSERTADSAWNGQWFPRKRVRDNRERYLVLLVARDRAEIITSQKSFAHFSHDMSCTPLVHHDITMLFIHRFIPTHPNIMMWDD